MYIYIYTPIPFISNPIQISMFESSNPGATSMLCSPSVESTSHRRLAMWRWSGGGVTIDLPWSESSPPKKKKIKKYGKIKSDPIFLDRLLVYLFGASEKIILTMTVAHHHLWPLRNQNRGADFVAIQIVVREGQVAGLKTCQWAPLKNARYTVYLFSTFWELFFTHGPHLSWEVHYGWDIFLTPMALLWLCLSPLRWRFYGPGNGHSILERQTCRRALLLGFSRASGLADCWGLSLRCGKTSFFCRKMMESEYKAMMDGWNICWIPSDTNLGRTIALQTWQMVGKHHISISSQEARDQSGYRYRYPYL